MSSQAILNTVAKRNAAARDRAQPNKRSRRKAATDPGGMQALERDTATLNESARQVDGVTEVDRESHPSTWKRSTALDAPPPRPGFIQRWVRRKLDGKDDTENYDRYIEEGWRPRKPLTVKRGHSLTTTRNQSNAQEIVKRGHVLMELSEKQAQQRQEFYQGSLDRQTKAVENELFADNRGAAGRVMPIEDATVKSRAALARRRVRAPAADESE